MRRIVMPGFKPSAPPIPQGLPTIVVPQKPQQTKASPAKKADPVRDSRTGGNLAQADRFAAQDRELREIAAEQAAIMRAAEEQRARSAQQQRFPATGRGAQPSPQRAPDTTTYLEYRDSERTTYLEYRDSESNKFYEVIVSGEELRTRWGRIGTQGQSQIVRHMWAAQASREGDKKVREKIKKGYAIVRR